MFENMKEISKLISSVDLEDLRLWMALRFHTGSLVKVQMIKKHVSQGKGWFFEKEINLSDYRYETVWAIKMDLPGATVVRTYLLWYLLEAETIFIYFKELSTWNSTTSLRKIHMTYHMKNKKDRMSFVGDPHHPNYSFKNMFPHGLREKSHTQKWLNSYWDFHGN